MPSKRIYIYMKAELKEQVRQKAKAAGLSMSAYICGIIERHFKECTEKD